MFTALRIPLADKMAVLRVSHENTIQHICDRSGQYDLISRGQTVVFPPLTLGR